MSAADLGALSNLPITGSTNPAVINAESALATAGQPALNVIDSSPSLLSQVGSFVGVLGQTALGFYNAVQGNAPTQPATPGAQARPSAPSRIESFLSGSFGRLLLVGGLILAAVWLLGKIRR